MKKRMKDMIEFILGKNSKTRFKRIITIIIVIGIFIFLITNLGYNKRTGIYIKPWSVEIKRGGE